MIAINNQLLQLPVEEAQEEIAKLIGLGYTDVILTFSVLVNGEYDIEEMVSKFNMYKVNFKGIHLHLGCELHYHYSLIHRLKKHDVLSLNQTEYILLRLPQEKKPEQFRQLISALSDYKVILSCVEEYKYFSVKDLCAIKEEGLLYLSNIRNQEKKKLKKLLKMNLIDFLSYYDDIDPKKAEKLEKICGKVYYNQIVHENYLKILNYPL